MKKRRGDLFPLNFAIASAIAAGARRPERSTARARASVDEGKQQQCLPHEPQHEGREHPRRRRGRPGESFREEDVRAGGHHHDQGAGTHAAARPPDLAPAAVRLVVFRARRRGVVAAISPRWTPPGVVLAALIHGRITPRFDFGNKPAGPAAQSPSSSVLALPLAGKVRQMARSFMLGSGGSGASLAKWTSPAREHEGSRKPERLPWARRSFHEAVSLSLASC